MTGKSIDYRKEIACYGKLGSHMQPKLLFHKGLNVKCRWCKSPVCFLIGKRLLSNSMLRNNYRCAICNKVFYDGQKEFIFKYEREPVYPE